MNETGTGCEAIVSFNYHGLNGDADCDGEEFDNDKLKAE